MTWTASFDKRLAREQTNLVGYVTYTDGKQVIAGVRIPGETEDDILARIARECLRLDAGDVRIAAIDAAVAASTVVPGPITLPDLSAQIALDAANDVLFRKRAAATAQKQDADLTVIDPTIPAAVEAQAAAALAAKA